MSVSKYKVLQEGYEHGGRKLHVNDHVDLPDRVAAKYQSVFSRVSDSDLPKRKTANSTEE